MSDRKLVHRVSRALNGFDDRVFVGIHAHQCARAGTNNNGQRVALDPPRVGKKNLHQKIIFR